MLEVQNLSHLFADGVWGLQDVSLTIPRGSWTIIAGANGAGKTLLMRHLVGLARPTEGRVLVDGIEVGANLAKVRQSVGLVFQDASAQIVGLTVEEEVAFGPRNLGWSHDRTAQAVNRALHSVRLDDRKAELCSRLSGGERRRLTIAGVLAMEPQVLLLDEPFVGLDFPSVRSVLTCLAELHRSGVTLVVLTHELEKCLALADSLVLMAKGRVLAHGSPRELWSRISEADTHRPAGGPQRLSEMSWLETAP